MSKSKAILITVSLILAILTVVFPGVVLINHQDLSNEVSLIDMETYSGGFPVSWFEYYYPSSEGEYLMIEVIKTIGDTNTYYKVELFAVVLNFLCYYAGISFIRSRIETRRMVSTH